jgi:hypothetical protein
MDTNEPMTHELANHILMQNMRPENLRTTYTQAEIDRATDFVVAVEMQDYLDSDQFRDRAGFLVEIDGMIESTGEFIADDKVTPDNDPEGRLKDLEALLHVRKLYSEAFDSFPS